ncbi:MAG TPA: DNRLRE domain-containing protein [Acidimicrobiia bacterium]|nr:DNRLRE domain-containing protein [Acidimicrobiia bacterium]
MTGPGGRRGRVALFVGAAVVLATALVVVLASATSLSVSPKNTSAFRTCVLTGYPTTSAVVADTWVDENAKTSNKKSGAFVQGTSKSSANKRAFLRFDLTRCTPVLATAATVKRATLRLSLSQAPASARTYNVQRIVSPCPEAATTCWTEAGLTWNNQPSVSSTVTSTLNLTSSSSLQYYAWDVTADAAAFVAGTAGNYGWRIADSAEGNATAIDTQFKSKDASANAAGAPELVIAYSP